MTPTRDEEAAEILTYTLDYILRSTLLTGGMSLLTIGITTCVFFIALFIFVPINTPSRFSLTSSCEGGSFHVIQKKRHVSHMEN